MKENFIECRSLSKIYQGKGKPVTGVEDIDLSVGENQFALIRGRSGAGKSTLLNLMCGLIKPTGGRVIIDGQCISELSDGPLSSVLSEKVGIIFQSFNLLPTYTVFENIEMAVVQLNPDRNYLRDNIFSLLEKFGLEDKADLLPSGLSAGQQQKVAIVRSLVKKPSIIFADEPTGSVDTETAAEIISYLVNLRKTQDITLVIATHGNIPETLADRVFNIENGRLK